jgi:hypothetical protein
MLLCRNKSARPRAIAPPWARMTGKKQSPSTNALPDDR